MLDQGAVQHHVGVPGLYRAAHRLAQLRRLGRQQFHGLGRVLPGRRGAGSEPGRPLGERLPFCAGRPAPAGR